MKRLWLAVLLVAGVASCKAGGCIVATLGDLVGETGDAHCDRRFVPTDREAAPFCQEVIDTVAQSQFEDDCTQKFAAATGDGQCARELVIGGCADDKINDDNSTVTDWYYDVTALEEDAGEAGGPDGGPLFVAPPRTAEDVMALCADPTRYSDGAHFVAP